MHFKIQAMTISPMTSLVYKTTHDDCDDDDDDDADDDDDDDDD